MLLKVKNIQKIYGPSCTKCLHSTGYAEGSIICPYCQSVVAVKNVSFTLNKNQVLGIVGESGSGKSTLLKIIYLLEQPDQGELFFYGTPELKDKNLFQLNYLEQNSYRNIYASMVHQKVQDGLNFYFSAGANVSERITAAGNRKFYAIQNQVFDLLTQTEIPVSRANELPAKFSGGQQQRIQIAKALANSPLLLLLDEPTVGLDVSIQARILDLIKRLQEEYNFSIIIVSHDLSVIRFLADLTIVMKNGEIVEKGLTDQIIEDPQHPYTQLLVSSIL